MNGELQNALIGFTATLITLLGVYLNKRFGSTKPAQPTEPATAATALDAQWRAVLDEVRQAGRDEVERVKAASKEEVVRVQAAADAKVEQVRATLEDEITGLQGEIRHLKRELWRYRQTFGLLPPEE